MRNDDIGAESDKFLGVLLSTIASPVGIAKLDLDVFTIRVAEGVQTAPKCIGERMRRRRGHRPSNKGDFSWSLCARPKRPRRSHSAEQRNELPSPHGHSLHARITHLTTYVVEKPCCASQHFGPPNFRNGVTTGRRTAASNGEQGARSASAVSGRRADTCLWLDPHHVGPLGERRFARTSARDPP